MKTVKAVTRKACGSWRVLAAVAAVLCSTTAAVLGASFTETAVDDLALAVIGSLLVLAALLLLVTAYLQADWAVGAVERYVPEVVWRIPTQLPLAALTIDDIPLLDNPSSLEEILDILGENEVRATLFVMSGFDADVAEGGMEPGSRARYKALLARAVAEGHELGNHMQFDRPAIGMTHEEFDGSFHHCDALLADLAGGEKAWRDRPRRWFRPASAMWDGHILAAARELGYTTVIANCFPFDTASATRLLNAPYLTRRVRPGAIVIVHDRWHTPATLRQALPLIAQRGLQLGTLSELQAAADAEAKASSGDTRSGSESSLSSDGFVGPQE